MIFSQFPVRRDDRPVRRHRDTRRRLLVESLEGRQLLSNVYPVTNANDSGTGSLRAAIVLSNDNPSSTPNTITFDIGTGGDETIYLKSGLLPITQAVVIDGTTQPGLGKTPGITLNGSGAGSAASGLTLDASGCTVKGLVIDSFSNYGVVISGESKNTITDDYIGVTAAGNVAAGNTDSGVYIEKGSDYNTVGGTTAGAGNVLSGNTLRGVHIDGDSDDNVVEGNLVGTDSTGTKGLGNDDSGVFISGGSTENTVGGTTSAARNILSANAQHGVHIYQSSDNVVEGNYVGTDVTGSKALGNLLSGVYIDSGSDGNVIGGTSSGAGNVLSANVLRGVHIINKSDQNLVEGNFIGTDATGKKKLGNDDSGVLIDVGSTGNIIGGSTAAARNVISANQQGGVHITGSATGNYVEGNDIGTDVTGTQALGNVQNGVLIDSGSASNLIGGSASADGNVISYNGTNGVELDGAGNKNFIGWDTIEDNAGDGVYIDESSYTTVSNSTIESNQGWGILVTDSTNYTFTNNTVTNNKLGNIDD